MSEKVKPSCPNCGSVHYHIAPCGLWECLECPHTEPSEKVKPNCTNCKHVCAMNRNRDPEFLEAIGLRCDSWELKGADE